MTNWDWYIEDTKDIKPFRWYWFDQNKVMLIRRYLYILLRPKTIWERGWKWRITEFIVSIYYKLSDEVFYFYLMLRTLK